MSAENTPNPATPDTIVLIHGLWMTSQQGGLAQALRGHHGRPILTGHSFGRMLVVKGLCDGL